MKGIENRKYMRLYSFASVLILALLLSTMIGTTVGKKPDNPGQQPPPPPPKYEFYISIGSPGDDVVLVSPTYLTVVSTVDSCGWNWPPKTGTRHGGWSADTSSPWNPIPDCLFDVNIVAEPYLPTLEINPDIFSISHYWSYQRVKGDFGNQPIDFWELRLYWGYSYSDPPDYSNFRLLTIWTDWGPELEGAHFPDGEVEVWTVDFKDAIWELMTFNEEGVGQVVAEGTIVNGFDVIIEKGDIVP